MRVLPIHMCNGELDFCTISVPVEASAYEAAIHIALACPGNERLRYHIARGSRTLFADGQRTEPFLAWQLATADGGIIADHLTAPNRHFSPQPVPTVIPTHIAEERFATRSHEVVVHRVNRVEAIVAADPSYGPQQLLTRIVSAINSRGSARLSFPALMPVCNPCRLHVVLHPRQPPTSDMATCLLHMRRVVRAPLVPWNVVELPTLCVLTDIQGLLQVLYPADLAYGAIYANYQRVGMHPVGVHRHTVITVLGPGPCEGLDAVYGDGTFGPLCFRGNDVAATRPGLAQFLAYPAHAAGSFFATSTTTTGGPLLDSGLSQTGVDEDPNCSGTDFLDTPWFTVLDTVCGVRVFTGDPAWTDVEVQSQAARMWQASSTCVPRRLAFEINSLPSPQILLCASGEGHGASTVVVDLTPFGGDICIRVTPSQWSVLDLVASIDTALFAIQPLARLQDATCVCLANRIIIDPRSALDPSTEVVQFYLLRVAAPDSCPAHPDTAPATFAPPTELTLPSCATVASSGTTQDLHQSCLHRTLPAAATGHNSVVRLPDDEGRYTVIGSVEGAINRWRSPEWDANRCLEDAIASAPRRGPHLSASIVRNPLPGLFVPQILVSRASTHLGWHTVALDLRPIALGVRAIEVRLGTTIGRLFEAGSFLFEELDHLGRMQLPFRYRLNSGPAWRSTVFSADAETLTVEEDFRPVTPDFAGMHPSLAAFLAAGRLPPWSDTAVPPATPCSFPSSPPERTVPPAVVLPQADPDSAPAHEQDPPPDAVPHVALDHITSFLL